MDLKVGDIVSSGNVSSRLFVVVREPYLIGDVHKVKEKVWLRIVTGKNDNELGKMHVADMVISKLKKEPGRWVGDLSMRGKGVIEVEE